MKKVNGFKNAFENGFTAKAERFVNFYTGVAKFNGSKAAKMAGYSEKTADVIASQLLSNLKIQAEIQKRKDRISKLSDLKAVDILNELGKLAKFDIRDYFDDKGKLKPIQELPDDAASALVGFDVIMRKNGRAPIHRIRTVDREKALVDYGRHIGMFIEKHQLLSPTPFNIVLTGETESKKKE